MSILKIDGYCCDHSSVFIFDWIFFNLAGKKFNHKKARMGSKLGQIRPWTSGLAALERLKKSKDL